MFRRACLTLGLFALGLFHPAAFASKLPMPLAQDLPVEIVLDQPRLAVDLSPVAADVAQQFGVIGGLLGVAIQKGQDRKADAAVAPLRAMLAGYPFKEHLETALHDKLASDGISPNPRFVLLLKPWDEVDAKTAPLIPRHALVLYPRYSIDARFARLSVRLVANVVDRDIDDQGEVDETVGFARVYAFELPLVKVEGADNRARWEAMGGPSLAADLDEGIAQVTDLFVYDLSAKGRAEWSMDGDKVDVTIKGLTLHGVPIRQTPDWAWVRTGRAGKQTVMGIEPVGQGAVASSSLPGTATPTAASARTGPATDARPASPTSATPAAVTPSPQASPLPASADPAAKPG